MHLGAQGPSVRKVFWFFFSKKNCFLFLLLPIPWPCPTNPPMQIFTDWRAVPEAARGATIALGNFDGVHLGHGHLIRAAHAARPSAPLAVLTFEPHPRELFRPDDPPFRLSLAGDRAAALQAMGVKLLYQLPFDAAFSRLSAEAFVSDVLYQGLGAAHLCCGPGFAFGHRRRGDLVFLAQRAEALGMGLTVVPPFGDSDGPLSSTRIRRALQDGYPERATVELGRPWAIRGVVAHGDKRGRTIGFPTANIALGRHLEPARGVYAVTVRLADGSAHPGVANIGRRPTVNDGAESRVEAHIFDFDADLYGQEVCVALHAFLRGEQKFASFDELTAQIAIDALEARDLLRTSFLPLSVSRSV
jgi:riboflavin kinase/FMN adenylyltransferase